MTNALVKVTLYVQFSLLSVIIKSLRQSNNNVKLATYVALDFPHRVSLSVFLNVVITQEK